MRLFRFIAVIILTIPSLEMALFAMQDTTKMPVPAISLIGEVAHRQVLSNRDTILQRTGYGDYWFGVNTGMYFNNYFGNLRLRTDANNIPYFDPRIVDFNSGGGLGSSIGIMAEWKPPDSLTHWGAVLAVALDKRIGNYNSPYIPADSATFNSTLTVNSVCVSPSVRYDLPGLKRLYVISGLDIDFISSTTAKLQQVLAVSGVPTDYRTIPFTSMSFRIGLNVGIGYDFLLMEVERSSRVRCAPFITIHYGSKSADDYGSNLSLGYIKVGFSLKLSKNKNIYDTLRFTNPPLQAVEYAKVERKIKVEVAYLTNFKPPSVSALAYYERPKVEVPPPPVPAPTPAKVSVFPEPKVIANEKQFIGFETPTSSSIDQETQKYLDAVALSLKKHPQQEVQIVGHADAFGTPEETQRVSFERARQVQKYLVQKGIKAERCLISGVGDRVPLGDPRSDLGKKMNRSVEVLIIDVKSGK